MSEIPEMRRMLLATSAAGSTMFRNNVAQAVVGKTYWVRRPERVAVGPDDVVVRAARVLHAGLAPGSSDLIGWTPVVVTPEMVGRTLAVFSAVEAKAKGGRRTPEQVRFVDAVERSGGLGGFAYTADEAVGLLSRFKVN